MTRILMTTIPRAGHVRSGIPVIRSLVEDGHEVAWYTGREFEFLVTGAGARFLPAAPDLAGRPGHPGLNRLATEQIVAAVPRYVDDVTAIADGFDPDVMVADQCFLAAPLVATQRRIPSVLFSAGPLSVSSVDTAPFGLGLPPSSSRAGRLRNQALHWLVRNVSCRGPQRMAEKIMYDLGFFAPPGFLMDWGAQMADRYLQASIPEFEHPRSDLSQAVEFVGPMLPDWAPDDPPDWQVPAWWPDIADARRAGRPVVLVAQGVADSDPARLVRPAISALADQDLLVIATTAGRDPAALLPAGRRPANVRLERFVPLAGLLPLADLMVTNGGFDDAQTALAGGVPLVVTGADGDRAEVGARVVRAGAGLSLRTDRPSAAPIRAALRSVLAGPSNRTRAAELKVAYGRYSGAARAAEIVVEVAEKRRAGRSRPQIAGRQNETGSPW
jgi:UDP:flavonoid glycosyltransferase YjiC (YdhE family)